MPRYPAAIVRTAAHELSRRMQDHAGERYDELIRISDRILAFRGVSEVHEEARAVAEMETERLEKLVELWDKGIREAAENAAKGPAKEGGAVKYSFAGERAQTADREQLLPAEIYKWAWVLYGTVSQRIKELTWL